MRRSFDLTLRRAAGNQSLKALALFSVDLASGVLPSERTLANKELDTASCIVASKIAWFSEQDSYALSLLEDETVFFWSLIRWDATNTLVSKGISYMNMILDCMYRQFSQGDDAVEASTISPEAVPVMSKDGDTAWAIFHRQVRSVGFPTLHLAIGADPASSRPRFLRTLVMCTDGGSDPTCSHSLIHMMQSRIRGSPG